MGNMGKLKQRARSLRSLLAAPFLGTFNDNAWKLMVILLLERELRNPTEGQLQHVAMLGFLALMTTGILPLAFGSGAQGLRDAAMMRRSC